MFESDVSVEKNEQLSEEDIEGEIRGSMPFSRGQVEHDR